MQLHLCMATIHMSFGQIGCRAYYNYSQAAALIDQQHAINIP